MASLHGLLTAHCNHESSAARVVARASWSAAMGSISINLHLMEMAHSIEGRVPFLDHHVVECLCRLPVSLKIRGMTEKYLLREAARPVITDTVYRRQKHPFLSPPVTTVPTERFHQMLQDTLRGPVLGSMSFYDQKKVVTLLDGLPAMSEAERVGWDPVLTSILSACILQERFKLNSGSRPGD